MKKIKLHYSMNDIFSEYYKDLTQLERDVITSTDYATANCKMFLGLKDFKEYAKEYAKILLEEV